MMSGQTDADALVVVLVLLVVVFFSSSSRFFFTAKSRRSSRRSFSRSSFVPSSSPVVLKVVLDVRCPVTFRSFLSARGDRKTFPLRNNISSLVSLVSLSSLSSFNSFFRISDMMCFAEGERILFITKELFVVVKETAFVRERDARC